MVNVLLSALTAMSNPQIVDESRKDVFREEVNGIIIDTVRPFDTGIWETGICIDGEWLIVKQYQDREKAKRGHNKYVKMVSEGKTKFKRLDEWEL